MKKLSVLIAFFLLIQSSYPVLSSQEHPKYISFINQVRGGECCDPGSIENLDLQLNSFQQNGLVATFAVRYDALKNEGITNNLTNTNHEIAGLLEVIPSLANDAGVSYLGDQENWYLAKHAFLVGYEILDREKLIDTYMDLFHETFDTYPTTTSAWMIDSHSLNYLSDKYGVTVHQITRDQWGTDTYTLYGGPFHYPYHPSTNWPLIPGRSPVLIVRQTVADPLYNYADSTASHTSQPNDYLQNKDFSYFKDLLTQTLTQDHNKYSFALLGLENSMPDQFQEEYSKQINWIKNFQNTHSDTHVLTASKLPDSLPQKDSTIIVGKDLVSQNPRLESAHINTNKLTARILRKDSQVFITDLRVFSEEFNTITSTQSSPTNNTYWITPFIIDSSRMPVTKYKNITNPLESIGLIRPNLPSFPIFNPIPDHKAKKLLGIKLPDINKNSSLSVFNQTIIYQDPKNKIIKININKEFIQINQSNGASIIADQQGDTPFSRFPELKTDGTTIGWDDIFTVKIDSLEESTVLTTTAKDEKLDITSLSHPAFYPDLTRNKTVVENSFSIPHNRIAISSQNPVRLFIYPIGDQGLPTTNKNIEVFSDNPNDKINSHLPNKNTDTTWVDISSDSTGKRVITTKVDGRVIDKHTVYFAPNCKGNISLCLKNPIGMIIYIYHQVISSLIK